MALHTGLDCEKLNAYRESHDKKSCLRKTSIRNQKVSEEKATMKRPKSSSASEIINYKQGRLRYRASQGNNSLSINHCSDVKSELLKLTNPKNYGKCEKQEQVCNPNKKNYTKNSNTRPATEPGNVNHSEYLWESHRKNQKRRSEMVDHAKEKSKRPSKIKKPSEIPKLKYTTKTNYGLIPTKINASNSKLPIKTTENENKQVENKVDCNKSKPEALRMALKSYRVKREAKLDEKIKEAMKNDFTYLIPLYESEFQKITEVWLNTLYCSLTMRTNLVNFLYQVFPQINKAQFHTEDETLHRHIKEAKNQTKIEADNLLQCVKNLQGSRDKVKENYAWGMANREIAQYYNHDWKTLCKKITETGEEVKMLQVQVPELQKKKLALETFQGDKIRNMEINIENKDAQIKKLTDQFNILQKKESSYKKNIFLKIQDYKVIKADVMTLQSLEKKFEEIKAKFANQNELYEKKIRDLEFLLEEKKKILEREKEVKQKLQKFLNHFQTLSVGKEQVDYVLGKSNFCKEKRREQLWLAAVKLVLKGFLIQMKKLEKDRNKMLLELQSNDSENFNEIAASLIKRDNFIKSIKEQMNDFQKAFKYSKVKVIENSSRDNS